MKDPMIKQNAGIYIDGANIFKGGMELGYLVDYQAVKDFIGKKYNPCQVP